MDGGGARLQGAACWGVGLNTLAAFTKQWLSAQYCFISSNQTKMVTGCQGPQSDIWADFDTVPEEEVNMCPIQRLHRGREFLSGVELQCQHVTHTNRSEKQVNEHMTEIK